ncbi:MAG: PQQ-binding-like beta-propeller repeat protein [Planctomycetes bacterium]|nr:PQQ-binding-like beta-propeller repeat protein [Planctomycetota bacterium]
MSRLNGVVCIGVLFFGMTAFGQDPWRRSDPYKDIYAGYVPDFVPKINKGDNYRSLYYGWKKDEEHMKLSSEKNFYTLNVLEEDSRANALVEAGLKKESEAQYREALKIYQQIIEKYPLSFYRVSEHGVFVPVGQYCQRRILQFPPTDLAFYRTLYDAAAKEAFENARRQYSMLGMADIAEKMLATSYGARAMLELGNAALDAGHFLSALEHFTTVRDLFPDADLRTPELALKIALCEKMLGNDKSPATVGKSKSTIPAEQLAQLDDIVKSAKVTLPPFHSQLASTSQVAADDYTLFPPSQDPMALKEPVWRNSLPGTRLDFFVTTQPVVTRESVIYRHKNVVYCRSLLNGEARWTSDIGGRSNWQDWDERQYPQEDVLVQDGIVFTAINKSGPSLVALDEVTGQMKWAFGPMVASNEEEARMRFETAPAGGPRTVYSGYVLDNIEGETHTDSEYGVIAFDSRSGRQLWRTPLCRLAPGKFSGGNAENRRNRIRSFTSPPLYHQGTLYYNTNAGTMAAIDCLSGRVKWLMRYPYYPEIHDATRVFGRGGGPVQYTRILFRPHNPMLWYNQRPMLDGERLFVLPVDSNSIYCVDRRTGKVNWTSERTGHSSAYMLGLTKDKQLAVAYAGRNRTIDAEPTSSPLHLLDPATGKSVWQAPDLVLNDDSPVMKNYVFASPTLHWQLNQVWFDMSARPHMTSDGRVYVHAFRYVGYPIYGWITNLANVDLEKKAIVSQRRYYSGEILSRALTDIHINGPDELAILENSPSKDEKMKLTMKLLKEVIADKDPENEHGPFLPFSRISLERYGTPFELRFSPRSVEMVYDRAAVQKTLAKRTEPEADLARAELAMADSRLDEASALLQKCLNQSSSEDLDLRAAVNQQLFRVHQQLTRRGIRASQNDVERDNALGMSRTASTLAEEMETLFAVAESHQRRGDFAAASKTLRSIIGTYGDREYPIAPLSFADGKEVVKQAHEVMDRYQSRFQSTILGREIGSSLTLNKKGLSLYLSTMSPLPKTLTVRAGEFASYRLMQMQQQSPEFLQAFQNTAEKELGGQASPEVMQRLAEFPASVAAQKTLDDLLPKADRRQRWALEDVARAGGLKFPSPIAKPPADATIAMPQAAREHDFADEEGASRLILERKGDASIAPQILFIGSQIRKRLDNKFVLTAWDLTAGKPAWETDELRLKGKGQEPGFFEAFLHGDLVVVHGLYDVLAFNWKDGKQQWRYQVPFDFEIRHALLSGDLLVLAGKTETLALYVPTEQPVGEVAWQVKERGDLYTAPYLRGDRVVSVRKFPFSVTVRFRTTGQLIGRLDMPDLSMNRRHPLIDGGAEELPTVHFNEKLVLTDAWYYIMLDVDRLSVTWKRLIDQSDVTRDPAMRFYLGENHFAVLKEDYDLKAFYMLSAVTGEILWQTETKKGGAVMPLYSMKIADNVAYGIQPHAGQGFYLVARDATKGQQLYREEVVGFQGKPEVSLWPPVYGDHLVVQIADRQTFELRVFNRKTGKQVGILSKSGIAPIGVHGRVSIAVQNGRLVMLSKDKVSY